LAVSLEDDWPTVMIPRLKAADADLTRVHKLSIADIGPDGFVDPNDPIFPTDTQRLNQAITQTGAKLVMLDPAQSLMFGNMDRRDEARRSLNSLAKVAQETGAAIVLVAHFGKGRGPVAEKLSGSHAFRDATRSLLVVALDRDTGRRILSIDKANYGTTQGQSFSFAITPVEVALDDGHIGEFPLASDLVPSQVSVADILSRDIDNETTGSPDRWLSDYLADAGGEAKAVDVWKAGADEDYSKDQLKRAKIRLKIESARVGGSGGYMLWRLPTDAPETSQKTSKGANSASSAYIRKLAPFAPFNDSGAHSDGPGDVPDNPQTWAQPGQQPLPARPEPGGGGGGQVPQGAKSSHRLDTLPIPDEWRLDMTQGAATCVDCGNQLDEPGALGRCKDHHMHVAAMVRKVGK